MTAEAEPPSFRLAAMGLTSAFGTGLKPTLAALRNPEHHVLRRYDGFYNAGFEAQTLALPPQRAPQENAQRFPELLAEALDDLIEQHAAPDRPVHLVLMLPEGTREADALLSLAAARIGSVWSVAGMAIHPATGGPALADWLVQCGPALAQRGVPVVVVLIDSLCAPGTLRALDAQNRLFSRRMPWGLIPGEGAAAMLLLPDTLHGLRLMSAATAQEPVVEYAEADTDFAAMSDAAARSLPSAPAVWVSDWNNSRYRAAQLAHAMLRHGGAAEVMHPAARFGDCGGVFGALAIVFALAHRDLHDGLVIVSASNAAGLCGCFVFGLR